MRAIGLRSFAKTTTERCPAPSMSKQSEPFGIPKTARPAKRFASFVWDTGWRETDTCSRKDDQIECSCDRTQAGRASDFQII